MNNGFPNGFPNGNQNDYYNNNNYDYNGYGNNYGYQDNGYPNNFQNYQQHPDDEVMEEEGGSFFFVLAIVIIALLFAMYFFKFGLFKDRNPLVSAESISLNLSEKKMGVGQSINIEATIDPKDSTDFITWSSSDEEVATVDSNGKVTARKEGSVTITAKANDKVLDSCVIYVVPAGSVGGDGGINAIEVYPTSITLSDKEKELAPGETYKFVISLQPDGVTNDVITWSSSDITVATVYNGEVTAVKPGTTKITAKTSNGIEASATVTVKEVAVKNIIIDRKSESVTVGGSVTIVPEIEPATATNLSLAWSSSNKDIAKVDGNGVVTGLKVGKTTITVKASNGVKASVEVNVVSTEKPIESIKLSESSKTLKIGESFLLKTSISPSDATNKAVTWSSSDKTIATVSNGKVTARKAGTVTIKATTKNNKTASCTITVKKIEVSSIELNKTNITLGIGASNVITATVKPSNANDKSIKWSSSDNGIVSVDSSGNIKGISAGTATIKAEASNGVSAEAKVTVKKFVTLFLDRSTATISVGDVIEIDATVSSGETITWSSSNSKVAKVQDGVILGVSAGTATIKAKAGDSEATIKVTVTDTSVKSVTLNQTEITLDPNKTYTLRATISPSDAADKSITWSTDNAAVATVYGGVVTGISGGTATITATNPKSGKKATCKVKVNPILVSSIKLDRTNYTMVAGDTVTISVKTYSPSNASNKSVTWSSSNTTVASVNSSGKVSAISAGSTTITATTSNGVKAYCSITVTSPTLKSISIVDGTSISMSKNSSRLLSVKPNPTNADLGYITWSSSSPSVVSVNSSGLVTALNSGSSTITAKSSKGLSATIKITVTTASTGGTRNVIINPSSTTTIVGMPVVLVAHVEGGSSAYYFTWTTSNSDICKVSATGDNFGARATVTGIKAGTCTVTANDTYTGRNASAKVTVQ